MLRLTLLAAALVALAAAQPDITLEILKPGQQAPSLAVPDFRGDPQSQSLMVAFNETLWRDLDDAGAFEMVPKSHYPLAIPQQASELHAQDWSAPPTQAMYLAMGYTAIQNGSFMLRAWLMDLRNPAPQVFEKRYGTSPDVAGARQAAHQFATDILAKFGVPSLFGTHIYFVRESPGRKEIWMMDFDGSNQRRIAGGGSIFQFPSVSPDGSRLAFTRIFPGPAIMLYSLDPVSALKFQNPSDLSSVASPSFTPDGKEVVFSQSVNGHGTQLVIANLDGSHPRTLTGLTTTDVEPKVNPKTGAQIAFVSGRTVPQQIYLMNADGTGVDRLTDGTGEASNPSWHPNGQLLAFAGTKGHAPGGWNIFIMDVARRTNVQLTHSEGRNENPVWAPDGRHLVFMSTRSGKPQIWSMFADGRQLRQLTTEGINSTPTWGR